MQTSTFLTSQENVAASHHPTEHPDTYLPPEDWEGLSTSLAYMTRTPWAGGRVCGVSRTGGKPEGSGPWPKPWLLAPDGPCTHDFIQQTTTWSPHGRGPCLTVTKLRFSINYQHVILEQKTTPIIEFCKGLNWLPQKQVPVKLYGK